MKDFNIEVHVEELRLDELPHDEQELVSTAIDATRRSNAKYSHFCVGAALRLANGMIIEGANQENASFPLSMCAERTAIFTAQVNYPDQPITHLAIAARNAEGLSSAPIPPCGACRQVMVEMEDRYKNNMVVLLCGKETIYRLRSAQDLLPLCFLSSNM